MRFFNKKIKQDLEENEVVHDRIVFINQKRLFLSSPIGLMVVLLHVLFFWFSVSPITQEEALWKIGVIITHSTLFFWFLLVLTLTWKSRRATEVEWWMVLIQDLWVIILFIANIALVTMDQWVTPNITPIIMASMMNGMVLLIKPSKSILFFLTSYLLYYYMISLTQGDPALLASNRVNGLTAIALGIGLSIILWRANYRSITQQHTIERQTHDLRVTATRQRIIASLSSDFINTHIENLDEKIHGLLKECGDLFQVDWTFLFQFSSDEKTLSNTHEWSRDRDLSLKDMIQNDPLAFAPYVSGFFRDHQMFFLSSIDDLPQEAKLEKERLREQGVESVLYLPLLKED